MTEGNPVRGFCRPVIGTSRVGWKPTPTEETMLEGVARLRMWLAFRNVLRYHIKMREKERMRGPMIEVDISNVWGELALPDLLAMEKAVFDAHLKLTEGDGEGSIPGWLDLPEGEAVEKITRTAEKIRRDSEICVVVGTGGSCRAARTAMEWLQPGESSRVLFAGDSLSTRQWKELTARMEGKDFSVVAISGPETIPESAIALRGLRWMLERKYGTDEANVRMYAVTDPAQGALCQMAREAGWETFPIPANVDGRYSALTAAGLLPMAVAGIDIAQLLKGAGDARESYDLRAYENPVWLYAAVRHLLCRGGKRIELLSSFASGFRSFGFWWQQLFAGSGQALFPAAAEYPADLRDLAPQIRQGHLLETLICFAPGEEEYVIGSDWKDLDGLNTLAGKTLAQVEEQAGYDTVSAHGDAGVPVITVDCGPRNGRTLGELFYFMELACGISQGLP